MPFHPGQSGNLRGRPKLGFSMAELARQHAPLAIETLVNVCKSGKDSARVAAATALLDRAYGKPLQTEVAPQPDARTATFDELLEEWGRRRVARRENPPRESPPDLPSPEEPDGVY